MKLRGIDFGCAIGASGVQGFFGEGYPYHRKFKRIPGFDFNGMTFTAKTMTLHPRKGNMPLQTDGLTPVESRPKCIHVTPRTWLKGAALNAVGLSNAGAHWLLGQHRWQERTDAFFISFMSVEKEMRDREYELREFIAILRPHLPRFKGKVALQINFSCPNVGLKSNNDALVYEILCGLDIAEQAGIPIVPKINLLIRPDELKRVNDHPACDAICVSNTLPWWSMPEFVDWYGIFKTTESPLKEYGGGGLSGAPLFPILVSWLRASRGVITKPIIAGGGILSREDVVRLGNFAKVYPSPGSVAFLRPWRLQDCIQTARHMFS